MSGARPRRSRAEALRVCFYWLNLDTPPGMSTGVSLLARLLADAGHQVRVVHLNEQAGLPFDLPRILAEPGVADADVHALSFGQNHASQALSLATALKAAAPSSHLVCGGIHTTLNAEEVLVHPAVDAVGVGEVDDVVCKYFTALAGGEAHPEVPGFWVKVGGQIRRTPLPPLPDLQGPGLPFFEGVDYARIITASRGFADIIAGRGCVRQCHYCHNDALVQILRTHSERPPSRKAFCRQRPVARILAEIEEYRRRFPTEIRALSFIDDTFTGSRPWLRDFSRSYRERGGLPFVCNAIPEQVDSEVAQLLADAGCYLVKFGVESGSERVRREVLGRKLSEERLAGAVAALGAVGVNTRAYVLHGAAGDPHPLPRHPPVPPLRGARVGQPQAGQHGLLHHDRARPAGAPTTPHRAGRGPFPVATEPPPGWCGRCRGAPPGGRHPGDAPRPLVGDRGPASGGGL
jgi:anaerobic magnesium-protoporphyrin IX monomethyl ester cyclase